MAPGAYDNLTGDQCGMRMMDILKKFELIVTHHSIENAIRGEGVGDGQKEASVKATLFGAVRTTDKRLISIN